MNGVYHLLYIGLLTFNNSRPIGQRTEPYVYWFDQIQITIIHTTFTYM